jgi:uroporphyrinogen-III synthase
MKVLLTRRAEQNSKTARLLEKSGISCVAIALSRLVDTGAGLPDELLIESGVQRFDCMILTSSAALEVMADRDFTIAKNLRVFAVGEKSAAAAREAGFSDVVCGPGNAGGLASLIVKSFNGKKIRAFYPCGTKLSFDMAAAMADTKIELVSCPIYHMEMIDPGRKSLCSALVEAEDGAVFQFSVRSAEFFAELLNRHDLSHLMAGMSIIANSNNVAAVFKSTKCRRVMVAEHPNVRAMVATVRKLAEKN